jgi:hypothetical protein
VACPHCEIFFAWPPGGEDGGAIAQWNRRATNSKAGLKSEATRTAPGDGSQHDTNKLEEAKEIIRLFSGIPIPEEIDTGWDCVNVTLLNCNIRRARSFLKENGE